jgi:hypothetical protein
MTGWKSQISSRKAEEKTRIRSIGVKARNFLSTGLIFNLASGLRVRRSIARSRGGNSCSCIEEGGRMTHYKAPDNTYTSHGPYISQPSQLRILLRTDIFKNNGQYIP